MSARDALLAAFLQHEGVQDAQTQALAGDASNRRYLRLTDPAGNRLILMDAPPENGEDVGPFQSIARHLRDIGLSAPVIHAADPKAGFLLLEDLGDGLFARLIERDAALENSLYQAASDVLITLRSAPVPSLAQPDATHLATMTGIAFEKYAEAITGRDQSQDAAEFQSRFHKILDQVLSDPPVLALRDYHAENLIWLPDRDGPARVGLLDFQDAFLCHPAYDLVSLLQDARRDVSPRTEAETIRYYIEGTGCDAHPFTTAYAVLGTQRNLRILGVFGRLCRDYGKPHYVKLIPRVWGHLMRDLYHPAMQSVAGLLRNSLPEPTPENLSRLRRP
ncbi:phosphotransferase [Ruegeria sp. 2205SS24-7]|uniref:aminoglycoside phosphotransferase family protein n=1 Tax=Ruegeria discodermiae TaxID=3064389 RepID=UPI00274201E6|nr:phosphotransferase [Ruegeria sp. 2205SS24-7]MDP5219487.1 phosphotransferase [Ruegeria sp. 2205SS24-7]